MNCVKPYELSKCSIIRKGEVLLYNLFPRKTIKKHLYNKDAINNENYDFAVMSVAGHFMMNFLSCNSNANLYFIDDGAGSYQGNIIEEAMGNIYKLYCLLLHRGPKFLKVLKLFVNNKKLCKSTLTEETCQLPIYNTTDSDYNNLLLKIFENKISSYNERIICLCSPSGDILQKRFELEKQILDTVKNTKIEYLVRLHPREKSYELFSDYPLDDTNNMWEIICMQNITDSHILIAYYSTAQMTPKIIYNKEPYIIFLFGMDTTCTKLSTYETAYIEFKNLYTNKNKIYAPKTIAEFETILQELEKMF